MKKLVRDKIPEIIQKDTGKLPLIIKIKNKDFSNFLTTKLKEETDEFFESGSAEELVDILEVVYAIAKEKNISPKKLEQLRIQKKDKKGSFEKRIVIDFK